MIISFLSLNYFCSTITCINFIHILGLVTIQSCLATSFFLRPYNNVIVNKVNKNDVTLDILEVIFKDNFVTRGDSWRFHRSLIGSCIYVSQKVHFMNMRISVNEMWMHGDRVACGVVGEKTKVS